MKWQRFPCPAAKQRAPAAAGWSDDEASEQTAARKDTEMETWLILEYANRGSLQVRRLRLASLLGHVCSVQNLKHDFLLLHMLCWGLPNTHGTQQQYRQAA